MNLKLNKTKIKISRIKGSFKFLKKNFESGFKKYKTIKINIIVSETILLNNKAIGSNINNISIIFL